MMIKACLALLIVFLMPCMAQGEVGVLGVWGTTTGSMPVRDKSPAVLLSIYVVQTLATDVAGAEFKAPLPPCTVGITYLGDTPVFPTIGDTQNGVSISYGACRNSPVHVITINVLAQGLTPDCCYYPVLPHPVSGQVRVMDCDGNWLVGRVVPTYINGDYAMCQTPVEQSTWGKIKALFE